MRKPFLVGTEARDARFQRRSSSTAIQVRLRRQFLQEGKLPFTGVLSIESISQALKKIDVCWKDRIYTPLVTLWIFLGQVFSADHSCRAAVVRLIAHRISLGDSPCCSETGAYWQARKGLPEAFFSTVACQVGRDLDAKADPGWLWKGRRVYMFDGSTVSMRDTLELMWFETARTHSDKKIGDKNMKTATIERTIFLSPFFLSK